VHIVAISTSFATTIDVLFTLGICKISDWREYCINFFTSKESAINFALSILCIIFITILHINVSNQMVTQIINNNHILYFAKLTHLFENILIKSFEPWVNKKITFKEPFRHLMV